MKLKLDQVTLVAVTNKDIDGSIDALKFSSKKIDFNSIKLFSPLKQKLLDQNIYNIQIRKLKSIAEWGEFITFELYKYIDTKFIILIHADGFIVNPENWLPSFLNYDYIGAPWPKAKEFYDGYGKLRRVGNSVSLRSYKLLKAPTDIGLKWSDAHSSNFHEDGFICVQNGKILEDKGIKFANFETSLHFSREYTFKENKDIDPFVFHKWYGKNKTYPRLGNEIKLKDIIKDIYLSFKYK